MWLACLCLAAAATLALAQAQPPMLNQALNEEVTFIPYDETVALETTIFKPDGPGPFPLVVINHGKDAGYPADQARARHFVASREFVRRGYVVASPMRAGFSRSGGVFLNPGCDIAGDGMIQAGYVRAAIEHLKGRSYVDPHRILVIGQSHGGLTTMAFGSVPVEGVVGLVNFSGGLKVSDCPDWPVRLERAFGDFGSGARLPSLWFYGDNDSLFPIDLARQMYKRYGRPSQQARLVTYGIFKSDSHGLFNDLAGVAVWWPETEAFLRRLGLPTSPVPPMVKPADTGQRRLMDVTALPTPLPGCRRGYETFLDFDMPRAFAIAENGACGYSSGGADPQKLALERCASIGRNCQLYVVDTAVVWR